MTNQLAFNNTTIQSVKHNNQVWITSSDLAKLLQYSSAKSVTTLYNRNADEFTCKMTLVIKMMTNGINNSLREKSVRIFSLRGAHLLAMLANTSVAKEVRKWLLDLADKEIGVIDTISIEQQQAIKQAVNERVYRTGEHYQAIYHKLYECFKIPRYQDLPTSKFDEAIKFLGGVKSATKLSDEDWYDLAWLYKVSYRMINEIIDIEPALRAIKSTKAATFWSLGHDNKPALFNAKRIIERETAHISDKGLNNKWNSVLPFIRRKPKGVINFAADIAYLD